MFRVREKFQELINQVNATSQSLPSYHQDFKEKLLVLERKLKQLYDDL